MKEYVQYRFEYLYDGEWEREPEFVSTFQQAKKKACQCGIDEKCRIVKQIIKEEILEMDE